MRDRWQVLLCAGVGLIVAGHALGLSGCSTAAPTPTGHPPVSQLKEGLTVLDAHDAAWGFNAAYVKDGRVVYIESRVGAPKPEVYRTDSPTEPANEMDLRFVDSGNHTFWAQRGGDGWVDPAWTAEITMKHALDPSITLADRDRDYTVAQEGAKALVAALPATFHDHTYHLGNFTSMTAPTRDAALIAKANELATNSPASQEAYSSYADSVWTQLYSAKYSKGAGCTLWTCGGSHSAVAMYANPNVGYWQYVIASCNHGPCPGGSGLRLDCNTWNGGAWFPYGVQETGSTATGPTGGGDGQGGCQTPYNWDSGGYDHLCNDDAAYELWQTLAGSQTTNMGYENGDAIGFQYAGPGVCRGSLCGSGNPAYYACNCGSFHGCSGDWNTPNCPSPTSTPSAAPAQLAANPAVFDANWYIQNHSDLCALWCNAGSAGLQAATVHWINHGIAEGRQGIATFWSQQYLSMYADLTAAFGSTGYAAAINHYILHGMSEGRAGVYGMRAEVFNVSAYLSYNSDLCALWCNTGSTGMSAAVAHWLAHGIGEGRRASATFWTQAYLKSYPALAAQLGPTNYAGALQQYILQGIAAGNTGL